MVASTFYEREIGLAALICYLSGCCFALLYVDREPEGPHACSSTWWQDGICRTLSKERAEHEGISYSSNPMSIVYWGKYLVK